ncbi:MAG TPA: hypothetical protein DEB40_14430, partial [Elusimicrobia bacterium]|nr:hypothetical protein [Elusimicrobiota bacterium]
MAALVAAVAVGAALRWAQWRSTRAEPATGDASQYFSMGLALRDDGLLLEPQEPLRPSASRGILYPAFIALVARAFPARGPDGVRAAQGVLGLICIVMVFLLGTRCHSPGCGLVAACFLAVNLHAVESASSLYIECFFSFLILIVAIAWVEWSGKSGLTRLAWAIGLSLTCRSTLFALPVLLPLWLVGRRQTNWRNAAFFAVGSYALLVPWTLRNAWHFQDFIPLERGTANVIIYAGSLGLREAPRINDVYRSLSESLPNWDRMAEERHRDVLLALAAGNLRRHPLRYVRSCAQRMFHIMARFKDMLGLPCFLLLLIGTLSAARNGAVGALSALLAYWFAMHSLMALDTRYLLPILPQAGVLVGAGFCAVLKTLGAGQAFFRAPQPGAGDRFLRATRWMAAALYAVGIGFMAHEAWSLPAGNGISGREAKNPSARNWSAELDDIGLLARGKRDEAVILAMQLAHAAMNSGQRDTALKALNRAQALGLNEEQTRQAAKLLYEMAQYRLAWETIAPLARGRRPDGALAIQTAKILLRNSQAKAAQAELDRAMELELDPEDAGQAALLYQELKRYGKALSILD